jgi:hypothetical protein
MKLSVSQTTGQTTDSTMTRELERIWKEATKGINISELTWIKENYREPEVRIANALVQI